VCCISGRPAFSPQRASSLYNLEMKDDDSYKREGEEGQAN
jgi:hypothetical protein